MAPLPDNDKTDKNKEDKDEDMLKGAQKDEKTLSNLNDRELKALLDEAINYKNPKDREGKSELFNDLLLQAEETERIARATSAGGSELVRHCNPQARRHRHNGGVRGRRYGGPTTSSSLMGRSVSERGTHGGSLDNLAKEELYEATCRRLRGARKSSTSSSGASSNYGGNQIRVSARQREGGSLPCNVNAGESSRDLFDDGKRPKDIKDKDYTVVDMETEGLLENDHLQRSYEERHIQASSIHSNNQSENAIVTSAAHKYTTKASLQIQSTRASAISNVDDPLSLDLEGGSDKNADSNSITKMVQSKYSKVDENGNALHQNKEKKKKKQADKNVVVLKSENIEGHRSEIIDNVEQLVHYIEGTTENSLKSRSVQSSKSRQFHKQHNSEDGGSKTGKRKHPKAGGKENGNTGTGRHELKKSNSLGEISERKLGREFEAFGEKNDQDDENVVLRTNKTIGDRTRERRSWGTVEPSSFQTFYNATSLENLETSADNWVVTRPKKKSKKRRNSVSSASAGRQTSSMGGMSSSNDERRSGRAASPDLAVVIVGVSSVKTTRSMPHSEKSNDSSSDVDSVHSLPMDGPISYADIAKNSEKKKPSPEKQERPLVITTKEKPQSRTTTKSYENEFKNLHNLTSSVEKSSSSSTSSSSTVNISSSVHKNVVPDVHNIKSFPAITGTLTKSSNTVVSHQSSTTTMTTSDKAVQSPLTFEESFVQEKSPPLVSSVTKSQETIFVSEVIHSTPVPNDLTFTVSTNTISALTTPTSSKKPSSNPVKTKANKETVKASVPNRESSAIQVNQSVTAFVSRQCEVHNELPLMRDTAQYATQRMPPDIVDVSTIEKLQFMNCSTSPQSLSGQSVTVHNSTPVSYTPLSSSINQKDIACGTNQSKSKRKKSGNSSKVNCARDDSGLSSVCDNNLGERDVSSILNGVSDEIFSSPEPSNQSNSPPPVVILSGHNKDVPSGLVFGFDINEQLLLEDSGGGGGEISLLVSSQNISENTTENSVETSHSKAEEWAKRYKPPANSEKNLIKHNHDKIVSYISSAWDNVIGQNFQYYSDEL
ncbi:uncharacterized protein LOC115877098 isoform X2 [Sitophilus oryzae]|uniref:Uncharacterized protein LOC115877098 isoform X2 n=1 Tax=Sitophilus oryzae TaxID=7048 RepID=A0A6J2XDK1_SITOR|nr:uncharacterized protein LOC115877098 isoform X2 [Sitophilus oryzae]